MMVWNAATEWWNALSEDIQGALIGATASLATAILAAIVVVAQVGHQAGQAINQIKQNEAIKLKLEIYQRIILTCESATGAGIELASYIRNFRMQLSNVEILQAAGAPWDLPSQRFPELSEKHSAAAIAAIGVISTVEQWRIVDPRMGVFQTAMNVAIHEMRERFTKDFVPIAIRTMPLSHPATGQVLPWQLPSQPMILELEIQGNRVIDAIGMIGSYVDDFQREMQNLLVGDLFPHRVSPRKPLDPRLFAVSLDRHAELEEHFHTETDWGRFGTEAERRAVEQLAKQNSPSDGLGAA